jgi:hypothetical protein
VYEKKDRENFSVATQPNQIEPDFVSEIEKAIKEGKSQYAYELSLKATQATPQNIEAWLLRAALAPSLEERVICVNHLNELGTDHQDRHNIAFFTIKEWLDRDPFLAYLEETEELYRATNADHMVLSIQKRRAPVESSLPQASIRLKAAYRWLVIAIIGLMFAGIGTLIFAPLAALAAMLAGPSLQSRSDRLNSTIVLFLAIILFLIGSIFSLLFVLHLIG